MRSRRESFLVKKTILPSKGLPQADELFGKITDAYICERKAKKAAYFQTQEKLSTRAQTRSKKNLPVEKNHDNIKE